MDRLLLDAHTVIWWDSGSKLLGANAMKAIQNATAVFVSAASEWELAIKAGLGKVSLQRSILQATLEAGFEPLAISFQHAQAVRGLRQIHKDPYFECAGGGLRAACHIFSACSGGSRLETDSQIPAIACWLQWREWRG